MKSEIECFIDRLVEQKTFSLEAMDAISEIKKSATTQQETIDKQLNTIDSLRKDLARERTDVSMLNAELERFRKRDSELLTREKNILQLEIKTAVNEAKSSVYADVFHTIFRNTVVRKEINGRAAGVHPTGGYVVSGFPEHEIASEE